VNLYPNPTAPLVPLYPKSAGGEKRPRRSLTWLSPHGSKRLGMSRMSAPAVTWCDTGTLKPTYARTWSNCRGSSPVRNKILIFVRYSVQFGKSKGKQNHRPTGLRPVSIERFIESPDQLSFGGRVNTPSRLKALFSIEVMLSKPTEWVSSL
jgi:hypothetical protein